MTDPMPKVSSRLATHGKTSTLDGLEKIRDDMPKSALRSRLFGSSKRSAEEAELLPVPEPAEQRLSPAPSLRERLRYGVMNDAHQRQDRQGTFGALNVPAHGFQHVRRAHLGNNQPRTALSQPAMTGFRTRRQPNHSGDMAPRETQRNTARLDSEMSCADRGYPFVSTNISGHARKAAAQHNQTAGSSDARQPPLEATPRQLPQLEETLLETIKDHYAHQGEDLQFRVHSELDERYQILTDMTAEVASKDRKCEERFQELMSNLSQPLSASWTYDKGDKTSKVFVEDEVKALRAEMQAFQEFLEEHELAMSKCKTAEAQALSRLTESLKKMSQPRKDGLENQQLAKEMEKINCDAIEEMKACVKVFQREKVKIDKEISSELWDRAE